jgi:outer membrane protein assembly factor BamD
LIKKHRNPALALILGLLILAVIAGCGGKLSLSNLGPTELFDRGLEKYNDNEFLDAIQYFQTIVYNHPGEAIVDKAQYYMGLAYFGNKDYIVAQVEFNRLVMNYPSSPYFVNALFMRAVSFYESTPRHYGLDQSDLEVAIRQLEDFIIDYPESELIDQAREILAEARARMARKYYEAAKVYNHIRAYGAAKIYLQKVIDDYTDSKWAVRAAFDLGKTEFKQGNFDEAARRFEGFAAAFPQHQWADEARDRAGEASFAWAKQAYDNEEYSVAKERFEAFLESFAQSKRANDAREYLRELTENTGEHPVAHDSSGT